MPRRSTAQMPLLDSAASVRGPIAEVALAAPIDKTYSYAIPAALDARIQPGVRVQVRFGRAGKLADAYVLARSDGDWDSSLLPIEAALDDAPLLTAELLELARWIARYYACAPGIALGSVAPLASRREAGFRAVRYVALATPPREDERITARQQHVLQAMGNAELRVADLCTAAECTPAILATMQRKGWLRFSEQREATIPRREAASPRRGSTRESAAATRESDWPLNPDQQAAYERVRAALDANRFRALVLFGVTGSGKTEVYVHAIRDVIARGRQAILLVPEIALTTQTLTRLSRRFDRVAVIHSGVSNAQRSRDWAAIAAGEIDVVIGTRSAVFAPCPRLGLMVVDEEQEGSYKNLAAPRYHTRDVAIMRAHLHRVPILLGSATPSLETWYNVERFDHFELLRLPRRVAGLSPPTVEVVDLRFEHHERRGIHLLSRRMERGLREALARREQSVVLLNRRGYANYLFCPKCQTPIVCPHCGVYVVLHQSTGLAHCHYCRARLAIPTKCAVSGCGGRLVRFGMGTERVEEELRAALPEARIARMDSDVMSRPADYARVLAGFERGEIDVLVGTQMIAKGLDFPRVSFVGVVNADTALSINDFRSTERTFQLTLQVAGRAGRSEIGGSAVVQTFHAALPAIAHAVAQDYEGFARGELASRRRARLPPFTRLVRVVLADARIARARDAAAAMVDRLRERLFAAGLKGDVSDAQPCALPRLRDEYRFEVLLTFDTSADLLTAMESLRAAESFRASCRSVVIDVDPLALQ